MPDSKSLDTASVLSGETISNPKEFFITFDDMKCKAATVSTSEDDSASGGLYKFVFAVKKPQLTMQSIDTKSQQLNPTAQVSYHTFSTKMDLELNVAGLGTQSFMMKPKSKLAGKPEYNYLSPSLGGVNTTWQTIGALAAYFDFILLDNNAIPLARFIAAGIKGNWSSKKIGRLEVTDRVTGQAGMLDEVVVTLVALVYNHFMQVNPTGALAMASSVANKITLNPSPAVWV